MLKFKSPNHKNLFIFGFIICAFSICTKFYHFYNGKHQDPQKLLEFVVNEQNKDLPKDIAPNVRLDKVVYEPNLVYVANYTLTNETSKTISKPAFEKALATFTPQFCNQQQQALSEFFSLGITPKLVYHGKGGEIIGQTTLTPEKCNFLPSPSK